MDPTKQPQDASQFARDDKELLLGGKEVGTNAQGLASQSIDESPQLAGATQASGIPSGAGSGGQQVNPDSSEIHSNLTSQNMTGQGFGQQEHTDGVAGYQTGFAEGLTGKGGVHLSNLQGVQPQQYGTPNQPGDSAKQ